MKFSIYLNGHVFLMVVRVIEALLCFWFYREKEKQDVTTLLRGSIKDRFSDPKAYEKLKTKEEV